MAADLPDLTPIRVVLVSLDRTLQGAVDTAEARLRLEYPNLSLKLHAAADFGRSPAALELCQKDIATADIVVTGLIFLEDQIKALHPALQARAEACDAMAGCLSASEIVKLTRLGKFNMDKPDSGPIALLKKLRGSKSGAGAGAQQAKMLKRLPKILRYIPGTAQDVRAYFLTLQYWLSGTSDNVENMVRFLMNRYASGERTHLRGTVEFAPPTEYPDVGIYHPDLPGRVSERLADLHDGRSNRPAVGLILMRSYVLSGDTGHYDGVIRAIEAEGLRAIPVFASGLDARPAIDRFFKANGQTTVEAVVSLTGFSLVGGPAFNDADAAVETLKDLDLPYISAQAIEFQSLEDWRHDGRGLTPIEATLMVAIPELDGATGPMVFGGRLSSAKSECAGCDRHCRFEASAASFGRRMEACRERAEMLARRVAKLVALRTTPRSDRRLAITLFNFPPNGGGVGTAAYLAVYESLLNLLRQLQADGYETGPLPGSSDALKDHILQGNAAQYGTDANVTAAVPVEDHIRKEARLEAIEAQWGKAPGKHLTDGKSLQILGVRFGNVLIGIQPGFGYEGDPMRLLFEQGFAPTHAFAAYYRYLREDFAAHAVLHFGTHGALEFMPGKQTGLGGDCWSDYLIGDLPNVYFYAANNPSEAAIAKRRSAATVVSYLTPAVGKAGLYKDLADLKSTIDRWRGTPPQEIEARARLLDVIKAEAESLDLDGWAACDRDDDIVDHLRAQLMEIETSLIPNGLHVAGDRMSVEARIELLNSLSPEEDDVALDTATLEALIEQGLDGALRMAPHLEPALHRASQILEGLDQCDELGALVRALDGRFVAPVGGGDVISNPDVLPTGRNIHGFDPFRLPSPSALLDGRDQAHALLDRHRSDGANAYPETIALVLWGTDNLKSEGAQLAQALALMGAKPRFDGYGRLSGADLIPLSELGRPRIDVVVTLSGIFRDLLPLQSRMLAEAALTAARTDEPEDQNFIRKHVLALQASEGCDLETAALRVFSNAEGAYGSNVNQMIDGGCWDDEDELAEAYSRRKCYAYGTDGTPVAQQGLLNAILSKVDLAYQNLESVDLGVTTIDHYFDTLGGIGKAVERAKGQETPIYIGDQTRGSNTVRTLSEQISLESRTRTLNPKWYEGMLRHGYEGVRQIEAHVTNTMGWSATTGQVDPWIYQSIGETFVLDEELRNRLAQLNPKSCANLANRLLEASDRNYWQPDAATLEALTRAGEDLEDRVEGIIPAEAPA